MARILINGCSTANNLSAESFMVAPEILWNPLGDKKYKIKPINSWICPAISPQRAILRFDMVNGFFPKTAIAATTITIIIAARANQAKYEWEVFIIEYIFRLFEDQR